MCLEKKNHTAWKICFTARCHPQHFYFHRATKSLKTLKTMAKMVKEFQVLSSEWIHIVGPENKCPSACIDDFLFETQFWSESESNVLSCYFAIRWWESSWQGRWLETLKKSSLIITELVYLKASKGNAWKNLGTSSYSSASFFVEVKNICGEDDWTIHWTTFSAFLKTTYWIRSCLCSFGYCHMCAFYLLQVYLQPTPVVFCFCFVF